MKCKVSRITFSAATDAPAAAHATGAATPDETALFTTMLLDIALKPISDAAGVLGSAVTGEVAAQLMRSAADSRQ